MGSPITRRDYWEHPFQPTPTWPAGNGVRTTNIALALTGPGKRVILHAVKPLAGANVGTPLVLRKGDGTTAYLTGTFAQSVTSAQFYDSMDIELPDGLSMTGGSAGSWIISFTVLR